MKVTRVTREPNNGTTIVWEQEVNEDMLETGIDTLQRARILNAAIEKERPYYYPKKQTLSNNWQFELEDMVLDRGVR